MTIGNEIHGTRPSAGRRITAAVFISGAALATSACGSSGADPEDTQQRVSQNVPGLVDNTMGSMDVLSDSAVLAELGESLEGAASTFGGAGEDGGDAGFRLLQEEPGGLFGGDVSGEELAEFLAEEIFTDENYEGDGYFRIGGELFCPADPVTSEPQPECVDEIDDAELRLRTELTGDDGIDIFIAVGPDRAEPLAFELRPDSLAVAVHFEDLREAALFAAQLAGESPEDLDIPDVLEGEVAATITVLGDEHVSIAGAVREDIRIEGDGMSVSLDASDPIAELEINGSAESVTASVDMGRLGVTGPWSEFDPESLATGEFELDWGGFSAEATLEEDAETLQIENIGFGDTTSTLSLDGEELFALDLNPESDRSFTFTVIPEDGEPPMFGFDPRFDLSLAFALQALADAGDDVPSFLLDETYRVALTGSQPTVQPVDADGEFEGGIRIESGEFLMTSTGADRDVEVEEGDCLVNREAAEDDHPVLGSLAGGACE